eukprot:TRINITY_DN1535_c0_g1_i1.p1 TRINITY_DN1535_c0_g1~~TRINITY_DN1535_c0_g1_i1.p1  ORF type:complete len:734 (+),score=256.86 TRINITY_DN1535_c0_g1_i1:126-2327(+)
MRIMVKGGVWKNTEDEILKAAVMKYGKNQWARISSLLVRKSAKQCKARWYEWIDPGIRKTEWSREEEEKLLHLAKIMPNQWKSIAPIVGRTAAQCLEHYEKLLDAAQNKGEDYDPADDPRRLRPGEIDPNPEAKPARPDPVDMDEDEKEMLSEARARLANTKGKKAKRKAREKQLEEARRMASLQKKRELKAAGIEISRPTGGYAGKKKKKEIDYNKEIPFQRKPMPGFYEVDWEKETPKAEFKKISVAAIEGKRRRDQEEEARKEDAKKQKLKEKKNLPGAIMQINKLNEAESMTARSRLNLPAPNLDDEALEEMAREGETEARMIEEEGNSVTRSLLPSYSAPTPVRRTVAPSATPSRDELINREALNLIALQGGATPLLGGENPTLHPTDFSGATPAKTPAATPRRDAPTPARTPSRDSMQINEKSSGESLFKVPAAPTSLRSALKSLPKPQKDYQIVLPELPEEGEDEISEEVSEDAADLEEKAAKIRRELEERQLRLQSAVLRRQLPRPLTVPRNFSGISSENAIEEMIQKEMIALIQSEAAKHPVKGVKPERSDGNVEEFSVEQLLNAEALIKAESVPKLSQEQISRFGNFDEFLWQNSRKEYVRMDTSNVKDQLEFIQSEFNATKVAMEAEGKRAGKLAEKLAVYQGGYDNRSAGLLGQISDLYIEIYQQSEQLRSFERLQSLEKMAAPNRISKLKADLKVQTDREADLQWKYRNLITQKEDLMAM